jgi:hypothetical protein
MPYEIEVEHLPAGIAASSGDEGNQIQVIERDFASDVNGQWFYYYLEGLESLFLAPYIKKGALVSLIDHCLVLMHKPNKATVYINELEIVTEAISKRPINVGEEIRRDDIAGITSLKFSNVPIQPNNGIAFYFSVGWRRGFFFDFRPNYSDVELGNIERELGNFYEFLLFYEIHSFQKEVWENLYSCGWFPFLAIPVELLKVLMYRVSEGRALTAAEKAIFDYFDRSRILGLLEKFRKQSCLVPHFEFLEAGINRYIEGDYISCISTVWPRIEGILRYAFDASSGHTRQGVLVDRMKDVIANQHISPKVYFPERFRDYLLAFYFKDFDLPNGKVGLSRNSDAHGVSDPKTYHSKNALLGILMVDQLTYYLQLRKSSTT